MSIANISNGALNSSPVNDPPGGMAVKDEENPTPSAGTEVIAPPGGVTITSVQTTTEEPDALEIALAQIAKNTIASQPHIEQEQKRREEPPARLCGFPRSDSDEIGAATRPLIHRISTNPRLDKQGKQREIVFLAIACAGLGIAEIGATRETDSEKQVMLTCGLVTVGIGMSMYTMEHRKLLKREAEERAMATALEPFDLTEID